MSWFYPNDACRWDCSFSEAMKFIWVNSEIGMSFDLVLKPSCGGCGSTADLYGSNCKHMTLCLSCGKTMAENHAKCYDCGVTVTRLIREYNVRASSSTDKSYFIGRFVTGVPNFSKKKNAENKWSIQKEGLQGRQITDALREKYKNKPWLLEDETGQFQYHGQLEGSQSAIYYLLMMQGKEFVAIPAGSWYNFNKVAQYKQLTLEEAEEKMKNRRKTADGYERWMMKVANNGAAAFGEVEKFDDKDNGGGGGKGRKKATGNDEEGNVSDRGEEDEEEEEARKNGLGLNKRGGDDDEEGPRGGDLDLDDDDIEKGDDWEHEEIFTDDDEAVGNDPEEREDLAPEVPAPPEIKQMEDEIGLSPVLAPKQKDAPKEEPADNSPSKPVPSGSRGTPPSTSKSTKAKRKSGGDDVKVTNGASQKKAKTENITTSSASHLLSAGLSDILLLTQESKPSGKDDLPSNTRSSVPPKGTPASTSKTGSTPSVGPVAEDEIRAALLQMAPVTTQELVAKFKARLKSPEDKASFAEILRRISKIQKTNGANYVVLRDR
ncbi:hypothetical protein HHK36_023938 [Tetracentron sinense]|uniref:Transcription initiation factor IIF subunit alpha n=1 Tax=Tetracentron sinense TaxID=13715 RepID=A0A834YNL8_TETSI|nr:hypothetical protein HHK36_023938 [Tetracentron sinense]